MSGRTANTAGLKPWKPGQSGNPNGRPKMTPEARQALADLVPKAVRALGRVLESDEAPAAATISAAREVLDRNFGKPLQAFEDLTPARFADLSTDELVTLADAIRARLGDRGTTTGSITVQ